MSDILHPHRGVLPIALRSGVPRQHRWQCANWNTHEICIAPGKPAIRSALAAANIPTLELQANASDPESSEAGVRLGTLYRIKGLEFKAVALCLTGESTSSNGTNPLAAKRQQCLHYVAATRARERLLITS